MIKILHNPRCHKSRESLALLNGKEIEIVEYLKYPPSYQELEAIIELLGIPAEELIRKNEKIFKEEFRGKEFSEKQWIEIMVEHPILIERPIIMTDGKAVIGRPPEKVLDLI